MKKHMKRILGIILMIAAVSGVTYVLQDLVMFRNDVDAFRIKTFYKEPKDSLDFVLMGSSEIMWGYVAGEAYRTTGLTSFPYAFPVNPVELWKYELPDIERAQHPKVLLIETNGALYTEDKYIHSNFCVETLADNMPLSKNRIKLISDLAHHPLERLFPILKYHYKWPKLRYMKNNRNLMLRKQGYARLRGARSRLYRAEEPPETIRKADGSTADLNPDTNDFLEEFLEEAQNSGIENILFIEYPHVIDNKESYERQQRANRAGEMIRNAGFEYISFMDKMDEIGLDPVEDFSDSDHMNARGQKKISIWLSEFIKDKYNIEPRKQTEKNRVRWEDSAELVDCYYQLFEEYTEAHKDEPYKKAEFIMGDNVRTMKELEKIKKRKRTDQLTVAAEKTF